MAKGDRSSSTTGRMKELSSQLPSCIPAMFKIMAGEGLTSPGSEQCCMPPVSSGAMLKASHSAMPFVHSLSLSDLQVVIMDITSTLSAAISDLKVEVQSIAVRMGSVEQASARQAETIKQVQRTSDMHLSHIIELHRHMDHHGRHHNISGLPEPTDQSLLEHMASAILNELLHRAADSPIEYERLHRTLRPRGRDPPGILSAV